jgi:hypothetical protein
MGTNGSSPSRKQRDDMARALAAEREGEMTSQ